MRVTVSVVLDDQTKIERTLEVDSADNTRFWSQGIRQGVMAAAGSVCAMVEAEYGKTETEGVHIVKDVMRRC